jgi:hypothetical protein
VHRGETSGLFIWPKRSSKSGRLAAQPEKAVFDFRVHFLLLCAHGNARFDFRLRANAPEGQKRFPISRMKKMPAITFLSVLAILFFGFELCPAQAEEPGLLDGMKFEGSLTEDGSQAAPFEETLIFENGEFLSKACIPYGFGKAPYKATREGDRIKWSAAVRNSDSEGDKAGWSGSVVGDKLTGKMIWSKANETIEYTVDAETPR